MAELARDVAAVAQIDAVPTILEVICRTTRMGFAAVARVTDDRWVACAVRDEIAFGIPAGGELPIEATLCRDVRADGELLVIDHASDDQRFCSHPVPQLYGIESYISVPITLGSGEFFGTLCAVDRKPARIHTKEIVGMFTLFARLIALQLDQQAQVALLETEVSRRTAALRETNAELARQVEITNVERESLRALAARLQRVREDERVSLAREVHDELGQTLTVLKIEFANLRRSLRQNTNDAVESLAIIGSMDRSIDDMLDGVHRILAQLRPLALDVLGFPAAATYLVADFGKRANLRTSFDGDANTPLPDGVPIVLFRVLQEALTNVSRHAVATSVDVSLRTEGDHIVLRVADDGRGISNDSIKSPAALGIQGMEERLRAVGGSLALNRRSVGGTEVVAYVPRRPS